MSKVTGQAPTNTLSRVVDLLLEQGIKINALEHVLKETNPLAHELYLGTIENLQTQKTAEVKRVFTETLKSKPMGR